MNGNSVVPNNYEDTLFYANFPSFMQDFCYGRPSRHQTEYEYNGCFNENDDPADYIVQPMRGRVVA